MKNLEKRKRIMKRSIRIGHCICDPRKPCPCDLFREKDICLCAGERLEVPTGPVKLTELIEKPGCASKIDQVFLKNVLKDLPVIDDPRVLVGVPAGDDAGIYDIGDGKALVQTVDVFCPSVDDPYTFGQIAAANSVSDIYAMGGEPLTALSIIGFPVRKVPDSIMLEMLTGGMDKMKEAGVAVIGGHSINDPEVKAGFAVTGIIEKDKVVTNADAKPGDVLILTKPLGVGIIAFASQISRVGPNSTEAIAQSMAALNKTASELMVRFGAHACTDVTGFSLMGHLSAMAVSSGVNVEVIWDEIPLFPGVLECVAAGILPGAIERNKESCSQYVVAGKDVPPEIADMCFDAQTSGGLLIAIAAKDSDKFLKALHDEGLAHAAVIGQVRGKGKGIIFLETNGKVKMPEQQSLPKAKETPAPAIVSAEEAATCEHADPAKIVAMEKEFSDFLGTINRIGGLDAYTKRAANIAISVLSKCELCTKANIERAQKMGFSAEEIDDAAWMGVAFGGSDVMMFYKDVKEKT
ncbi:MAG: selenide, water dikinase SelD [Planctomycetota bacterium]|jgi:selenide,water dikinase